jgi:hypothetical protein
VSRPAAFFFTCSLMRCRVGRRPACYSCAFRGDRDGCAVVEGEGRDPWHRRRGVGPRIGQGRGWCGDPPAERSDGGAESGDGGTESGPLSCYYYFYHYIYIYYYIFFYGHGLTCALQVADFTSRTASGALTAALSAEVERLRTQHADAVREKSASDSKCRKLADKVAALEEEKAVLRRQLAGERREANEAIAKEQAAQAEARLSRAEGNLAKELAEDLRERLTALESRAKGAEAVVRTEAERTRTQLMATYRELGARTGDFVVPEREAGLRCLEWVQEELQELPTVLRGLMSFASLVTCEGAMNALSREGCRHYEAFDQADEDFGRNIYKVEDPVVKESAGALYDRMWGLYGGDVVRERAEATRAQVTLSFVRRLLDVVCACVC